MTNGSDAHQDQCLKSADRKLQGEAREDSRRKTCELSPAKHAAVSEFLAKVSER
jgi:hypothetical protein